MLLKNKPILLAIVDKKFLCYFFAMDLQPIRLSRPRRESGVLYFAQPENEASSSTNEATRVDDHHVTSSDSSEHSSQESRPGSKKDKRVRFVDESESLDRSRLKGKRPRHAASEVPSGLTLPSQSSAVEWQREPTGRQATQEIRFRGGSLRRELSDSKYVFWTHLVRDAKDKFLRHTLDQIFESPKTQGPSCKIYAELFNEVLRHAGHATDLDDKMALGFAHVWYLLEEMTPYQLEVIGAVKEGVSAFCFKTSKTNQNFSKAPLFDAWLDVVAVFASLESSDVNAMKELAAVVNQRSSGVSFSSLSSSNQLILTQAIMKLCSQRNPTRTDVLNEAAMLLQSGETIRVDMLPALCEALGASSYSLDFIDKPLLNYGLLPEDF